MVAYGWNAFYKPQGYTRHPESLAHGRQEERVMLSPPGHVSKEKFFGINGWRIFYRLKLLIHWYGSSACDALKSRWRKS
ncbi:hypothetical protein NUKP38_43100 [Klebsiella variicola]|nr:hypothetical protein NUKP38_43100 [Klebsiella variicola]